MADARADAGRALYIVAAEDVAAEMDRGRALDQKLTQVATFSGLAVSLIGSVGSTLLARGNRHSGLAEDSRVAAAVLLIVASTLLLASIGVAYWHIAPKKHLGIDEAEFDKRVLLTNLDEPLGLRYLTFVDRHRRTHAQARIVNGRKATATLWAMGLVTAGMGAVVASLIVRAVGGLG
ncbi:MAG: hypothetical protein PGN13_09645 [Patulibacter minatonensis]